MKEFVHFCRFLLEVFDACSCFAAMCSPQQVFAAHVTDDSSILLRLTEAKTKELCENY